MLPPASGLPHIWLTGPWTWNCSNVGDLQTFWQMSWPASTANYHRWKQIKMLVPCIAKYQRLLPSINGEQIVNGNCISPFPSWDMQTCLKMASAETDLIMFPYLDTCMIQYNVATNIMLLRWFLSQTKMLVRGMLVTSLPQVCASLLQSKHDCISKCLWLRMRAW